MHLLRATLGVGLNDYLNAVAAFSLHIFCVLFILSFRKSCDLRRRLLYFTQCLFLMAQVQQQYDHKYY